MKGIIGMICLFCLMFFSVHAQQKIEKNAMNYVIGLKPNNILYHDTLFRGSAQFEQLFYRTYNQNLIDLYRKHQSNKIAGQVLGITGTLATIFGISMVTSSRADKGTGWALLGGGFATSLMGGYLTLMGQKNLQMAVILFNRQYNGVALGIGVSEKNAGLVFKF